MAPSLLKAQLSATIVLASFREPAAAAEHVRSAQQQLRGWTFHSAFQYVSGKRFLAALELTENAELRASWALAHVIAKELASANDWSGSGRATPADIRRYEQLAGELLAASSREDEA